MEKWLTEFTIEKADGTVRHASFESDNWVGVVRLLNVYSIKNNEKIIHVDSRMVKTLF